jgi:membrane protein CcdC involved in cytochrome C biogenesis
MKVPPVTRSRLLGHLEGEAFLASLVHSLLLITSSTHELVNRYTVTKGHAIFAVISSLELRTFTINLLAHYISQTK